MLNRCSKRVVALVVCSMLAMAMASCGGGGDDASTTADPPVPKAPAEPFDRVPPPDPSTTEPAPTSTTDPVRTIEVALAGGQVREGSRREAVKLGEQVRIRAVSDVAEELHVHTYDQRIPLQPGKPGEVIFTADIPGRHEVEFEKSGKHALILEVR